MRCLLAVVLTVAFCAGTAPHAQEPKPLDSEVKAVYLLNFGRLATWPTTVSAAHASGFGLCVFGRDPFGAVLDATVAGEAIDGEPVFTRRIDKSDEVTDCRMLFVSTSEGPRLPQIVSAAAKAGALTVSDMPQFVARGGMIQFVSEGTRLRFQVNAAAVDEAGLTLSSELLRIATAVKTRRTP